MVHGKSHDRLLKFAKGPLSRVKQFSFGIFPQGSYEEIVRMESRSLNARDLERILTVYGAGPTTVDTIARKLRLANRLPVGGRGINAPMIGVVEAAAFLAALAASDPASDADERVQQLDRWVCAEGPRRGRRFLNVLASLLSSPAAASEVLKIRIGRNRNFATIHFRDGGFEEYRAGALDQRGRDMFCIEGTISGSLLRYVAQVLCGDAEPPQVVEWPRST